MGFHSLNCEVCGFPLMCAEATRMGSLPRWLSQVVVIDPDGTITRGQYDGYGRVYPDTFELCDDQPALRMHRAVLNPMRYDGEQWLCQWGRLMARDEEPIMYAINHWETSGNTFDVVTYQRQGVTPELATMTPQQFKGAQWNAPHAQLLNTEGKRAAVYHGLCHEVTGSTTDYTGPSAWAAGQGWPAFTRADVLDAMRDPATWNEKWASWLPKATDEVPPYTCARCDPDEPHPDVDWCNKCTGDNSIPLPRGWIDIVS